MVATVTPRQREVLAVIAQSTRLRGFAPTVRELATALGVSSTNGVAEFIDALEQKGMLTRDAGKSRTIRITAAGRKLLKGTRIITGDRARAEAEPASQISKSE